MLKEDLCGAAFFENGISIHQKHLAFCDMYFQGHQKIPALPVVINH